MRDATDKGFERPRNGLAGSSTHSSVAMVDRAMILAAGRGERMRPLTDIKPKPLLEVHGKPLIVWHVEALARDGVRHIVVNTAWLEEQIAHTLGDGSRYGVRIEYSFEGRDHGGALETAGGIATARPWAVPEGLHAVGRDCYWLVSADIYCPGFRFDAAVAEAFAQGRDEAHLWLVPNPAFHAAGDFTLDGEGRVSRSAVEHLPRLTYANVALCRASLTESVKAGTRAALGPLLFAAADAGMIGGSLLEGVWENVGTPAQLARLNSAEAP